MEMKVTQDPAERTTTVSGTVDDHEFMYLRSDVERRKFMQDIAQQVEKAIVNHVAERFLAEHLQEVVKAIDPQAVANLALARAAQQLMERVYAPPPPVYETNLQGQRERVR